MKIAKDTGIVTVAEISVSPNLTRSALKVSSDFSAWQSYVGDAINYFSYKRRVIENESQRILVAAFFHVERLTEVELFYLLPNEPESLGWESWSEVQEMERKALHEMQLKATLGDPPYEFEWGKVLSVYDSRSGASRIIIRYNNP
jgi:hypothetical protein